MNSKRLRLTVDFAMTAEQKFQKVCVAQNYIVNTAKKDLCNKCVGYEMDTGSDYRTVWCKMCWQLGEKYRPKIEALNQQVDSLYEAWRAECKMETKP